MGDVRTKRLELRLTEEERLRWEVEARLAGMSLSEWVRETLDAKAGSPPRMQQPARTVIPGALCMRCFRNVRVGLKVVEGCEECKAVLTSIGGHDSIPAEVKT